MPDHRVLAVANRFLQMAEEEGVRLTPMHLQKLCYMAHGFDLAFFDQRLIADDVEAWSYGPVYPDLYDALKRYGSGPVGGLIHENNWASAPNIRGDLVEERFSRDEENVLRRVFETYARFPAFKLSALTHEEGSPWQQVFRGGGHNPIIADHMIRDYFRGLAAA